MVDTKQVPDTATGAAYDDPLIASYFGGRSA